jgi:hypothetical protein
MSHAPESPAEITTVCNHVRALLPNIMEPRGANIVVAAISNDQAAFTCDRGVRESCTRVHVSTTQARGA